MCYTVETCIGSSGPVQTIVSHPIISNSESLFEHAFRREMFALSIYVLRNAQRPFMTKIFEIKSTILYVVMRL